MGVEDAGDHLVLYCDFPRENLQCGTQQASLVPLLLRHRASLGFPYSLSFHLEDLCSWLGPVHQLRSEREARF